MEVPAFVARKHSTAKVKHISQNKQPNQNQETARNLLGVPSRAPTTSPPQFTPDKTNRNEGKETPKPPPNIHETPITPSSTKGNRGNSSGSLPSKHSRGWNRGGSGCSHGGPG
eukprot:6185487-Ditylum_brightwellii.AAC.1